MKYSLAVAVALALGFSLAGPGVTAQAAPVQFDAHGRPFVLKHDGKKQVRYYCRKGLYGEVQCPTPRSHLRYGPYDRDFAFSQGYQILR